MKVYKLEVYVLDFDNMGVEQCSELIEDHKYLQATVGYSESIDIGEWDDNHPLNKKTTDKKIYFDTEFEKQNNKL